MMMILRCGGRTRREHVEGDGLLDALWSTHILSHLLRARFIMAMVASGVHQIWFVGGRDGVTAAATCLAVEHKVVGVRTRGDHVEDAPTARGPDAILVVRVRIDACDRRKLFSTITRTLASKGGDRTAHGEAGGLRVIDPRLVGAELDPAEWGPGVATVGRAQEVIALSVEEQQPRRVEGVDHHLPAHHTKTG
jgi:hypothetical protein